jgi:hypothetical protein
MNRFEFVSLSKQGFLNIYNEIINIDLMKTSTVYLRLYNNQIIFNNYELMIVIRFFEETCKENCKETTSLKTLIELPGLDFYKCYYDGTKMFCTPEAIQCHKTRLVQYSGKIFLDPSIIRNIFRFKYLKFTDEFWQANKDYICLDDEKHLQVKANIFKNDYGFNVSKFPTKDEIVQYNEYKEYLKIHSSAYKEKDFASEYMFLIKVDNFERDDKEICTFIEEIIFQNPITSLNS